MEAISLSVSKPIFRIGFELEGLVRSDHLNAFDRELRDLDPHIDRGIDGSVDGYFATRSRDYWGMFASDRNPAAGIEIRTQPQPLDKGLKLFARIIELLAEFSGSGVFKTNNTCGLHVNLSEAAMVDTEQRFRRWYAYLVKAFPEYEVLRMFRRTTNTYCRPLLLSSDQGLDVNEIERRVQAFRLGCGKYHSIAAHGANTSSISPEVRRVEFRCLGNKDYHLKVDKLAVALDLITTSATHAYEQVMGEVDKTKSVNSAAVDHCSIPQALVAV